MMERSRTSNRKSRRGPNGTDYLQDARKLRAGIAEPPTIDPEPGRYYCGRVRCPHVRFHVSRCRPQPHRHTRHQRTTLERILPEASRPARDSRIPDELLPWTWQELLDTLPEPESWTGPFLHGHRELQCRCGH